MEEIFTRLGRRSSYSDEVPFGVHTRDRFQHLHAIGQTGTGKTTFQKNLVLQDIYNGEGCAFIDPHGDAAHELIDHIPPWRMRDVVYLNPADPTHSPGLNLLEHAPKEKRDALTTNIVGTFRYRWQDSWGPRMDYIFKHTVRALLDCPSRAGITLLAVSRMYTDPSFRDRVTMCIENSGARNFWTVEYPSWSTRQRDEYVMPIKNKVGQFLLSDTLRHIVGQSKSTINLDTIMNTRKILIANLDKGAIAEDDTNLIGSLLVTGFQLAAMRRSAIAEEERVPFFLHLDEFYSFTTATFISILSEARKYKLGLTLAHQYLTQLDNISEELREAIKGNVGTTVSFRLGSTDAEALSGHLDYPPRTLEELGRGEVAVRLMNGTIPSTLLGATDPPSTDTYQGRGAKVIQYSRERFSTPRDRIEARLNRARSK